MSDALMWANRTGCAAPDLGQLGSLFFESGRTQRGPAHSGWPLSSLNLLTGTGHAPVGLPRAQKGGQYSTPRDTEVMNWPQLQLFKVSRSG